MWRAVIALLLVPAVMWGQQQGVGTPDKQQSVPVAAPQPTYQVVTEWEVLRQGSTEKVIVRLFLGPFHVVAPYEPSRDLVPLQIQFEESDGVSAKSFSFPMDRLKNFSFHDEAVKKEALLEPPNDKAYTVPETSSAARNGDAPAKTSPRFRDTRVRVLPTNLEVAMIEVTVKLNVSRNAALGTHLLRGKIKYQPIFDNGVMPRQELEIVLPMTVVGHDANSSLNPQYPIQADSNSYAAPKHDFLWMILLAPIFIPLAILSFVVCGIRGDDCSC